MNIISHRGYWRTPEEKNTRIAFEHSFQLGFGTETDIRDRDSQLVIAHDMAKATDITLDQFLETYGQCGLPLAINIKADGLARRLKEALQIYEVTNYFVFDCSVPDLRDHIRCGNTAYSRLSDVEPAPAWLDSVQGIWLDAFESDWYQASDILAMIKLGKRVCVVSPELHGRDPADAWRRLRPLAAETQVTLCTDHPEKAKEYFK